MILKGSQRGGGRQLAVHLMNEIDNDHIEVEEVRGFISSDLAGALDEAHAVSKGTRCKQFLFSLSLNPPKGADVDLGTLRDAIDRAEEKLGLKDQPRAIVIHEKEGRRHAHVVWSRIDVAEMKAINLPFFKTRLTGLSKDLYLENGWELPDGHKENGWKNPLNFTLAEWQQAKRLGLDPREIKQIFVGAWQRSDNLQSFKAALEENGFFLAAGDRRGFVATDIHGEVFSVSRMAGVKTKDLAGKLGSPDRLPGVESAQQAVQGRLSRSLKSHLRDIRTTQRDELAPIARERADMLDAQRNERRLMRTGQKRRWAKEARARAERFRSGIRGVWEILTGRAATMRRENDHEALANHRRDQNQREAMFRAQIKDRAVIHARSMAMRACHRQQLMRLARQVAGLLQAERSLGRAQGRASERQRDKGFEP